MDRDVFSQWWVTGVAQSIRYNLVFSILTIFVYLTSKNKVNLHLGSIGTLVLLFFAWTTTTSMFGLANPEITWDAWSKFSKVVVLFVFILLIVSRKLHIDFMIWCLMLSVGFFAFLEGIKYIVSGGGHRIVAMPGHPLADNNDLALALAMLLPFCMYLLGEFGKRSFILKFGLISLAALIIVSIIGTNSRGGLIALVTVGVNLILRSKRKVLFAFLFLAVGGLLVAIIPAEWYQRMETIGRQMKMPHSWARRCLEIVLYPGA